MNDRLREAIDDLLFDWQGEVEDCSHELCRDQPTERCLIVDQIVALVEQSMDVLPRVLASLCAAVSLLERGGRSAAPSNKMFDMMLDDYRKAIEAGRAVLLQHPTHRHTGRGTEYREVGRGLLQCATQATEGDKMVVYVGTDGRMWIRPEEEFDDGRFEVLT